MGYEVLSADRQQGFAFETAEALVLYLPLLGENSRELSLILQTIICLDSHSEKIRNATNW